MTVQELINELVWDHAVQTGCLQIEGDYLLDLVEEILEDFENFEQAFALAVTICQGNVLRPLPRLVVSN